MQVILDTNQDYNIRIAQYTKIVYVKILLRGIENHETNSRNESQSVNKMECINFLVYIKLKCYIKWINFPLILKANKVKGTTKNSFHATPNNGVSWPGKIQDMRT